MKVKQKNLPKAANKDNVWTSVSGGRGTSIMDFMETYGDQPKKVPVKKSKRRKHIKSKRKSTKT